jgi:hypothetical protein
MSFEGPGRTSFDYTPRSSMDAPYPPHLAHAGSWSGQGGSWGAQLSSVPEQFPMINAPPPSSGWGAAGRFSLDAGTDRISEDMSRMSFEAAAPRWAGGLAGSQARRRGAGSSMCAVLRCAGLQRSRWLVVALVVSPH